MTDQNQENIRTLWLDDKISSYVSYIERLREQGFSIRKCKNNSEAIDAISNHEYDLILVDLKLKNETGIELLEHLSGLNRPPTTVVLSSFLYEEVFVYLLKDISTGLFLLEKNLPASDSQEFIALCEKLRLYVKRGAEKTPKQYFEEKSQLADKDPFEISYTEYLSMPPNVQDSIHLRAYDIVEEAVKLEAKKGSKWMVFCGDRSQPEESVDDYNDRWSEEDLEDLAITKNRVAFVFEPPDDPEDRGCGGSSEAARSYPTVNIVAFSAAELSEMTSSKRRRSERHIFRVHFDTGSFYSYLSLEEWVFRTGDPILGRRRVKEYRGKSEIMYEKSVPVRIQDQITPRSSKAADLPVLLVKGFKESRLTAKCPLVCKATGRDEIEPGVFNCIRRAGLIGRNLIMENPGLSLSLSGNPIATRL